MKPIWCSTAYLVPKCLGPDQKQRWLLSNVSLHSFLMLYISLLVDAKKPTPNISTTIDNDVSWDTIIVFSFS